MTFGAGSVCLPGRVTEEREVFHLSLWSPEMLRGSWHNVPRLRDVRRRRVVGPRFGQPASWFICEAGQLLPFDRPGDAVARMSKLAVSREALSTALSLGFVPGPETLLEGLYRVGFGHELAIDAEGSVSTSISRCVPNLKAFGTAETGMEDAKKQFMRMLKERVEQDVQAAGRIVFLQSGGKDSSILALALADWSDRVVSVTYEAGVVESESESAARVARKCGLRHVSVSGDPASAWRTHMRCVDKLALPVFDFAYPAYLEIAEHMDLQPGDVMVDGMGIDLCFGVIPSELVRMLCAFPRFGSIPQWYGFGDKLGYILNRMSIPPHERMFPGSRFTDKEIERLGLNPGSAARARLEDVLASKLPLQAMEIRTAAAVMQEASAGFQKGEIVADIYGASVRYPLADEKLCSFVERLPPRMRFDERRRVNKVLMREIIQDGLGDLQYSRTKGSFRFDVERFVRLNSAALRESLRSVGFGEHEIQSINGVIHGSSKGEASKAFLLSMASTWMERRGIGWPAKGHAGDPR